MPSKESKQPNLKGKRVRDDEKVSFSWSYCMCTNADGWIESKDSGKMMCQTCGKEVWFCPTCKKGVTRFSAKEDVLFECAFCGLPIK